MSVKSKHLATFLLGAAAGVAAFKYATMTPEEKEKMAASLKEKAQKVKEEAEAATDKAKDYFSELKAKGGEALKDHIADVEKFMHQLFGNAKPGTPPGPGDSASV